MTATASAAGTFDQGERHSCAVRGAAGIFCWGANELGQLGVGGGNYSLKYSYPIRTKKSGDSKAVTTGANHTCSLTRDGKAHCWGDNTKFQVGTTSDAPWVKLMVDVPGISDGVEIDAGSNNTCVLRTNETVACWGENAAYESGNTAQNPVTAPLTIANLTNVKDIDVGGGHACAVRTSGTVRCWGRNTSGQLGNGTTSLGRPLVQPVDVRDAVQVATGANHTCVLRSGGTVLCWGDNSARQVLPVSGGMRLLPARLTDPALTDVVAIAAGGNHTCALREDETIVCWGENSEGQYGDGTTVAWGTTLPWNNGSKSLVATKRISTATDLVAGRWGTCAKRTNGQILCWGGNHGQMGYGPLPDKDFTVPRRVHTLPGIVEFGV